jgi:hypothetical protein
MAFIGADGGLITFWDELFAEFSVATPKVA